MTSAVPGHGYRESSIVYPSCKCGWRGEAVRGDGAEAEDRARALFEGHKAEVRERTGYEAPSDRRNREFDAARAARVAEDLEARRRRARIHTVP